MPGVRPGWVTFVAVLDFIGGAFGILVGLLLLVGGSAFAAFFEQALADSGEGPGAGVLGAALAAVGVVLLLFGVVSILVGVNVMKGRNWARIVNIVLAILGILGGLASFPASIVSIALDILILVGLFRAESKAFFGVGPAMRGMPT